MKTFINPHTLFTADTFRMGNILSVLFIQCSHIEKQTVEPFANDEHLFLIFESFQSETVNEFNFCLVAFSIETAIHNEFLANEEVYYMKSFNTWRWNPTMFQPMFVLHLQKPWQSLWRVRHFISNCGNCRIYITITS